MELGWISDSVSILTVELNMHLYVNCVCAMPRFERTSYFWLSQMASCYKTIASHNSAFASLSTKGQDINYVVKPTACEDRLLLLCDSQLKNAPAAKPDKHA